MRPKYFALLAAALAAVLLLVTPLGAQAAKLITGKQVKDSSLTGKDVKDNSLTGKDVAEGTLGTVPSAAAAGTATSAEHADHADDADHADHAVDADHADDADEADHADEATLAGGLAPLGPGETQSGAFGAATGSVAGMSSGYLGFAVNYPRPLPTAIAAAHIIDTSANPDPVNCAGPGQAAPGYLCLYFDYHSDVDYVYGYPDDYPYNEMTPSVGQGLYAAINGDQAYVDGIWTVTAPVPE